jgi:type IV pilus assembly protein PilY1
MKLLSKVWFCLFIVSTVLLLNNRSLADDTCIFTGPKAAANIVILLDTGGHAVEQVAWHSAYDNTKDYTPVVTTEVDIVKQGVATGNGFFNENGYAVTSKNELAIVDSKLLVTGTVLAPNDGTSWKINNRTFSLPKPNSDKINEVIDSTTGYTVEVIDNVLYMRYSKNYLNWLFFGPYFADSTVSKTLPDKSRLYHAKKALYTVFYATANKAKFSLYYFNSSDGASQNQPLKYFLSPVPPAVPVPPAGYTIDSNAIGVMNGMKTIDKYPYSPLAEGLASVGGYIRNDAKFAVDCAKNFIIVVTPGLSSEDQGDKISKTQDFPTALADYDTDSSGIGEGNIKVGENTYPILPDPNTNNGSTYLDDVADYLYSNKVVKLSGQNVSTYTIGFMASAINNAFLINTSNNGNGNRNLYDSKDPEYGKYHFTADSPEELSVALAAAVSSIFSRTNSFTAPVVPVTRTTSGNRIYLSFFKPSGGPFWQGNVVKFGLNDSNQIVDKNGDAATYPNGALKESAVPFWATINWAAKYDVITNPNGVLAADRNILTYLNGVDGGLTAFTSTNITPDMLGNPTRPYIDIINYVRGADILDEDKDSDTIENREFITGDVLHSEPLVYQYVFATGSPRTMIYFGANDGMLHAVNDDDGTEAWGFIPPHQLPRLKGMVEGTEHLYFVDATPKIYHDDINKNKIIDGDEKVILVCGERKGSKGYFALDVTNPDAPKFLWRINQTMVDSYSPLTVIPELAESWSNPVFGRVKTTDDDTTGTPVLFVGAGYNALNISGKAILVIDVRDGSVVKMFKNDVTTTGMDFSIASEVRILDINSNGFIDKAYVGDMGGQMWRLGKFTAADGTTPLPFPASDENINNWTAQRIFSAGNSKVGVPRRFFYPPSITLERGYDLVHSGTGDRENPCDQTTSDLVFTVKDSHDSSPLLLTPASPLLNVTDPTAPGYKIPDLDGVVDAGWYYNLAPGEKMLAEGTVFYKIYYFTTFTPNNDLCVPGGIAKLYALNYKTGSAVYDFLGNDTKQPSLVIGGGIPSKPVLVLNDGSEGPKLLISVGSTTPEEGSESQAAGIIVKDADFLERNFFYIWWKELFN